MFERLALPLVCAPMSFASSVALAAACSKAGVVAGWQGGAATPVSEFECYLETLAQTQGAPALVNLPARIANDADGEARLALLERHRAALVLSSVGNPTALVERVHAWGGRVIQDVTTLRHAEKSIEAGVDGLMLTCAGAGGHTGFITPLAFVPVVRRIWDGLLIVGGGIADVRGMAAVLALGGDLACMGTRFIATPESGVVQAHREMIAGAGIDRIMTSAAMNGVPANWIRDSVEASGLDPDSLPAHRVPMPEGVRPWRDIFSAGQSVGLIDAIEPVANLVARMRREFAKLVPEQSWRARLAAIEQDWV
ncbi:nitronate monooxygenase family protein [Novosphingobium sp. NDB2Meth1]|uniref:NAD(P)H-dependent flavin oxidoreductase n=1 Tax=Novosphingobium sp. NDB2Meth1 TaxID=1892847 RepID=UPI000930541B|nr:nitronate monooxygenase [Novosphingobium sp. NDB2Meth1]